MKEVDLENLYKIEWTLDDNANAWIEPTTHCQLRCPKCFRDIGGAMHSPMHRDLDDVKQEILWIKKNRNVESITFGGGEPLMYPDLISAIDFCKKNNIKVRICSNGIGLNEELLTKLKRAGTNEILIHIDDYQGRGTKEDLFRIRSEYCDIFRRVKGVNLGFMTMMNDIDRDYIAELIDFFHKNVDIILLVSFIFTKDIMVDDPSRGPDTHEFDRLIKLANERYRWEPSAYIGKIFDKTTPSWLIYMTLFCDDEAIGGIDARVHGFSSRLYRMIFGRHWFLTNKKTISFFRLLIFIFNKNIRNVLWNFFVKNFRNKFRSRLNYQIITMNFGPDKVNGRWDLCDSCPDAMYYKGELVPSCLLERIKRGEEINNKIHDME